jgi:hypothetical protein
LHESIVTFNAAEANWQQNFEFMNKNVMFENCRKVKTMSNLYDYIIFFKICYNDLFRAALYMLIFVLHKDALLQLSRTLGKNKLECLSLASFIKVVLFIVFKILGPYSQHFIFFVT